MYLLLLDYGLEGWEIKKYKTLDEIKKDIKSGHTFGNPFIIAKEIDIVLEDSE